jgi:CheY-like chemotaxis protein
MPIRLLVVDDDSAIHMMVDAVLGPGVGYRVTHARDGQEALDRARERCPDVILLDCRMPGMDGPSVLENLRAEPPTAAVPVIFLTGKSDPEEVRSLLAQGATGVIAKPFHPADLQAHIEAILSQPDP